MESLYVRVPKRSGERIRKKLTELGVIDSNLRIKRDNEDLLIPVTAPVEGEREKKADFEILEKKESLVETLGFAPAYEVIGDIAIIDQYENDAQKSADAIVKQKNIKTVFQAAGPVTGEYRTRDLIFLSGENKTETLYRENGCRYLIDVSRTYFTPRLATERMRVANLVKDGDVVLDMFAGVGPFSILISKKFPGSRIIAIDKNPAAIRYLGENVRLNKLKNVEVREGDARDELKGISGIDHIIMNLPHSGLEFMEAAFGAVKKGGMIHFYAITHEDDLFEGIWKKIEEIAAGCGVGVILLNRRIVRPYAPYQHNICIDFKVISADQEKSTISCSI